MIFRFALKSRWIGFVNFRIQKLQKSKEEEVDFRVHLKQSTNKFALKDDPKDEDKVKFREQIQLKSTKTDWDCDDDDEDLDFFSDHQI